ncbi:MAG: multicopper oxidase domain-containing protein [Candidatus Acidiferrales bacterium]
MRVWLRCAAAFISLIVPCRALAQAVTKEACPREAIGSMAPEPEDLRCANGVLKVELTFRNFVDSSGQVRYCYLAKDGSQAPNLRLHPGDLLILTLKNESTLPSTQPAPMMPASGKSMAMNMPSPCGGGSMTAASTNLHFHGINVPPVCHQDDTLNTLIQPSDAPFEYRFRIPKSQPPGLYWYHPHPHGWSKAQVLGGASGALIIEGIERANPQLAGLPERVLIVRDQELMNPNAEQPHSDNLPALVLRDRKGDILNTGTGGGKPAKDLSLNFVPVPFPTYPPAIIRMKPSERQLWRVLNASAITYLNLRVLFDGAPQPLGVVALDGVPINEATRESTAANSILPVSHVILPPAGRVEFVLKGPPADVPASLVTRGVDTGPAGENDPLRALASIETSADAPEPRSTLAANPAPLPAKDVAWLGNVPPVRQRKLYFSERAQNPNDPNSPTTFFITVDGQTPAAFDPKSGVPNIVAQQGTVEDWVIENRSQEFHAFHIHQVHFLLKEWNKRLVNEPFLRDTVNVEYWDGKNPQYPSVKLRMDFRDPNIVGTFVYHCHLLEHEDGGMMGTIRVEPSTQLSAGNRTGEAKE